MLTEAEKAECFACWDAGKPWLGREMSRTEHAAISDEYNLRAAGVLPVMARKAAIAFLIAAARKDAACTERAMPYLVAQARAAGFGKPEDGDSRAAPVKPPGYHQFNLSDVCVHCGVTQQKLAERGGACRFVAEPASAVHVEPRLGRAMRKVREFDVMLGAVRWMAPK